MSVFKFKEFSVNQDRCAMKVGTDAVLLGAWTPIVQQPATILDIGSGTGILALMLAQRSQAPLIDAIEIDADAYQQCVGNFENSKWNDRLNCYHTSLQAFMTDIDRSYDLIVSNPPFFNPSFPNELLQGRGKKAREMARFQDALPFDHLLEGVSRLLSKEGFFSVIIPYMEAEKFKAIASGFGLFPNMIMNTKGHSTSALKRSLICFSFRQQDVKTDELIIETARHKYTQDYMALTQEFYLKM